MLPFRTLWYVFKQNSTDKNYHTDEEVRKSLHFFNIYPSRSQVSDAVHEACAVANRKDDNKVNFGEFCLIVAEMKKEYRNSSLPSRPLSLLSEKTGECAVKFFLGGSCNPTTWRADIALPYLEKNKITYYNPQRDDWNESLVEIENEAKENADILLFVIENTTRSTASMVEAANLAARGRPLILVVKAFEGPEQLVAGEKLSSTEYDDLCRSQAFLIHLVERKGLPVFNDLPTALECLKRVLYENINIEDLSTADGAIPVKCPHVRIGQKFKIVKEVFDTFDEKGKGKLNKDVMRKAFKQLTSRDLPAWLYEFENKLNMEEYSLEEFYCLLAEFHYHQNVSFTRDAWEKVKSFSRYFYNLIFGKAYQLSNYYCESYDVYLGGTCANSNWREKIAVPIFEDNGLTYYNPYLNKWTTRYIAREAALKDRCRVLLYVITDDSRGISSMLEAAYYYGLGCKVILCVMRIERDRINNEILSETAKKDYNRARTYLEEITKGGSLFNNVEDAVKATITAVQRSR
ncbi:DgyrCDS9952 [Dimorphilus gyrociliatus]|uniref:DgyrCDS9952 n=1 Tax=Dimorphilus gyrociliatus TaxID=2664684 RepID=A0A7I8VZW2_9ANNE|nr:DgyrCDS9952 [Dimorphilus gyrociliatus]